MGTAIYVQPVNAQISLLNGGFTTTTDVQDVLNYAKDVADMKETEDLTAKKDIYHNVRTFTTCCKEKHRVPDKNIP